MILESFKNLIKNVIKPSFFSYSQIQKSTTYPYLFGGINTSFQNNTTSQIILKNLFPSDTIQGFKQTYRFALYALQKKQKKNLQAVFQANLIKNIQFRDVNLRNDQSDIQTRISKTIKIFGSRFERSPNQELKLMENKDGNLSYIDMSFLNPTLMMNGPSIINNGIPVLLGFQILFKSQLKLVSKQSKANDNQQIHQMQFQVAGKIDITKYANMALQFSKAQKFSSPQEALKMLRDIIGKNYQWKVGDVDRVLNGNLIIKQ